MPLTLNNFPQVPPSRTALTTAEIAQYITGPAAANFALIEALIESIEATINALPNETKSASMPAIGNLWDKWIDESESDQFKVCINPYTSGNGTVNDWVSIRDAATLSLATSASAAAVSPLLSRASDFPTAYTENWIYVNSVTGATYVCQETYTIALPANDRASKFISVIDATTSAAVASAQAAINNFADDDIITANEKIVTQREWEQVQDNYALANTLAVSLSQTGSAQYIALETSYNALDLYLNTTLNIFGDLTSDSSLTTLLTTRAAWKTNWKSYYSAMRTFQDFISTTLDSDIDSVQSDETITESEKREANTRWQYEVKNYTQHDSVTDSLESAGLITKASNGTWLTYIAAYDALNTYLNTTLNLFNNSVWPLALSSKSSNAAEWTAKWQALTDSERDVSQLTNNTFAQQIDTLANDGIIAKGGEKILALQAWNAIYGTDGTNGEEGLIVSRTDALISAGNTSLSVPRAALVSAYDDLKLYLDGLSNFYDTTLDTAVSNSEWDGKWNLYYINYASLDKQTSSVADASLGLISGLVDDSIITAGKEHQRLIEQLATITIEETKMLARATIGVGASTTPYVAAYDALKSYLYTLFGNGTEGDFLNSTLTSTTLNPTEFRSRFEAYYTAREDLQSAIIGNNFNNLSIDSAAIPNMAVDGSITSEEKYVAQTYWTVIYGASDDGEHSALNAQAINYGVSSTYVDPYNDAFTRLWNFLTDNSHGAPASEVTALNLFVDMGATTALDGTQQSYWQTYWSNYYTKRDVIIAQIQASLDAAVDSKIDKDGSVAMAAALNMGSQLITNLAQGTTSGHGVEYDQWNNADTARQGEITGLDGRLTTAEGDIITNTNSVTAHTSDFMDPHLNEYRRVRVELWADTTATGDGTGRDNSNRISYLNLFGTNGLLSSKVGNYVVHLTTNTITIGQDVLVYPGRLELYSTGAVTFTDTFYLYGTILGYFKEGNNTQSWNIAFNSGLFINDHSFFSTLGTVTVDGVITGEAVYNTFINNHSKLYAGGDLIDSYNSRGVLAQDTSNIDIGGNISIAYGTCDVANQSVIDCINNVTAGSVYVLETGYLRVVGTLTVTGAVTVERSGRLAYGAVSAGSVVDSSILSTTNTENPFFVESTIESYAGAGLSSKTTGATGSLLKQKTYILIFTILSKIQNSQDKTFSLKVDGTLVSTIRIQGTNDGYGDRVIQTVTKTVQLVLTAATHTFTVDGATEIYGLQVVGLPQN